MNEFKDDKIVAFAGHRYEWHCIGVQNKLPEVLEDLINKGYTIFYDGHYGAFDFITGKGHRSSQLFTHNPLWDIINLD